MEKKKYENPRLREWGHVLDVTSTNYARAGPDAGGKGERTSMWERVRKLIRRFKNPF